MYKHIIWDFDGTLFDSYPVMGTILKDMLKEEGIIESLDEILKYMTVSMSHAFKHYKSKYDINDDFIERYHKCRSEIEISNCKPYLGIEEICKYIDTSGRNNYLYTHRGESAIVLLKKYDLYRYFKDFVISQHGFKRKPCPDAIMYFVDKHHMNHQEAIMIGDRELDILAAKNAGIDACFYTDRNEKCDIADFSIHNILELYSII